MVDDAEAEHVVGGGGVEDASGSIVEDAVGIVEDDAAAAIIGVITGSASRGVGGVVIVS